MQPKDLTHILRGTTPGEWLALSMDRTRILGRGKTAKDAKAAALKSGHENVVLFCVPLPNVGIAASSGM